MCLVFFKALQLCILQHSVLLAFARALEYHCSMAASGSSLMTLGTSTMWPLPISSPAAVKKTRPLLTEFDYLLKDIYMIARCLPQSNSSDP